MRLKLLGWLGLAAFAAAPRAPGADTSRTDWRALTPAAQSLMSTCLGFADRFYDERAGLMWSPIAEDAVPGRSRMHYTRDSCFYAAGLLVRDGPGDRDRALRMIRTVLGQQIDAPGKEWDANYYAYLEEPPKTDSSQGGNLRQFIGAAFALAIKTNGARIPEELQAQMWTAIDRGVQGEFAAHRLPASYTNVALMQAWLAAEAGRHDGHPDWVARGESLARAIDAGYRATGAFAEYNSPTYYGVDFYGLALWRQFPPTPLFGRLGAALEADLWRDVAALYHPGLGNICGPYDRAYGMDMHRYVAATALWMALAMDPGTAPLPRDPRQAEHPHDYDSGILYALLSPKLPPDTLAELRHFRGEHRVTQPLSAGRVATSWLGDHLMLGGEFTAKSRMAGIPVGATEAHSHNAMATAQWQMPGGGIGWFELLHSPRCDVAASRDQLVVDGVGDFTFRIGGPGVEARQVGAARWTLPGLTVEVTNDANGSDVIAADGHIDIRYREATRFRLRTAWRP